MPTNNDTGEYGTPGQGKPKCYCPNCGVFAAQQNTSLWWGAATGGGYTDMDGWSAQRCASCHEATLWKESHDGWHMVHPHGPIGARPSADMPDDVKAIFEEARTVAASSPRSAAALLRLTLQMLIDALAPGNDSINGKIATMVKAGLDPHLQQAMDVLRVVGNNAVHPGTINLEDDPDLVPGLFALVNLIVQQMISAPKYVQSLYSSLPQAHRDHIAQRDKKTASTTTP